MSEENYPSNFYHGIPNKDYVYVDSNLDNAKTVTAEAFQFEESVRDDGYRELSINWNDDEKSLSLLFEQKKENGKYHFPAGVVKLELILVKQLLKAYIESKELDYERRKIEGNPYHGNLLLKNTTPKQARIKIRNGLSLIAEPVIENPNCI